MIKSIFLFYIFFGIQLCFGQIKDGLFEKIDINPTLFDLFSSCKSLDDTTFSGIKKTQVIDKSDTIVAFINYNSGKKIKTTSYYQNEKKYRETHFNGEQKQGWDIKYFKNGNLEFVTYFENGIQYFSDLLWYEDGNLKSIRYKIESENREINKSFFENGMPNEEYIHLDTLEHGCMEFRSHRENGSMFLKSIFNCGVQELVIYYGNNKIMGKGFINTALWSKVGKWEFYYQNGIKMMELNFESTLPNILNGIWSYWDEKGRLLKQCTYLNGILTSEKTLKKTNQTFYPLKNKIYPFDSMDNCISK